MKKTVNVLNPEDVKAYAKTLARNAPVHVQAWFASTFQRWLSNNEDFLKQCVNGKELRSPIFKVLTSLVGALASKKEAKLIADQFQEVEVKDLPAWALPVLENNELWFWNRPDSASDEHNQFQHWVDYCATLPERDIRMTVPQMIAAVAAWDKQLAKQKLIAELSEGTELLETKALATRPDVYMVRLMTQTAYKNESAVMRHCVKTYWGRKNTRIYSLRKHDEDKPIATIELCKEGKVVSIEQVRGFANAKVADEYALLIEAIATEQKWELYAFSDDEECEEDEEDEDEYDDDDGEDYEDEDEDDDDDGEDEDEEVD